jgi:Fic family protein
MTQRKQSLAKQQKYVRRGAIYSYLKTCLDEVEHCGGLPTPREAAEMWGDIFLKKTHHSTGIEGNKLTHTQVEELLQQRKPVTPGNHRDYLEIRGYADAAQWAYSQATDPESWGGDTLLTVTEVRHLHQVVMGPVWESYPHVAAIPEESPGSFRRHDIESFPGGMQPPTWPVVPALVHDWVESVNRIPEQGYPAVERVALRHAEFERIHPFLDGNGRTGRLLLNLLLVRLRLPPAIILKERRDVYLSALRACDAGEAWPLGEVVTRGIIHALKQIVFPCICGPGRYVLLSVLSDDEFTRHQLWRAAKLGRLAAVQDEDGFWRSTPTNVQKYKDAFRARTAAAKAEQNSR